MCIKKKHAEYTPEQRKMSVVASDIHVGWSTHVIQCMRNPIWDLKEALGKSSGTWSRIVWLEGSYMSQVPSASSWADIPRNWSKFLQRVDSIYHTTRCHISKDRTPKQFRNCYYDPPQLYIRAYIALYVYKMTLEGGTDPKISTPTFQMRCVNIFRHVQLHWQRRYITQTSVSKFNSCTVIDLLNQSRPHLLCRK